MLDDCLEVASFAIRRRFHRALDKLTALWATGNLPPTCAWMLDTQLLWLQKGSDLANRWNDDDAWLQVLDKAETWQLDVPDAVARPAPSGPPGLPAPKKVRPIQMGEFMRKFVAKRLHVLGRPDLDKLMLHTRQLGVGMSGGAEALALLHQCVFDLWESGCLPSKLARIKIDLANAFGSLEWDSIRAASQQHLPRHHAVMCSKHAHKSVVRQDGLGAAVKNRGAEQGDVDGPAECAVLLAAAATRTRHRVHELQAASRLPWADVPQSAVPGA
eukprot:5218179-Amphidinium_carterae.1